MLSVIKGLVLRSVDYKDSSKMLTVLCAQHGIISVSARGVNRKGSRMAPACQPFCYSEMTLFERGGKYTLNAAAPEMQFAALANQIENMSLACYFAEILMTEPEGMAIDPDIMRLALNALYALSEDMFPRWRVKAAFEMRYMSLCGYAPQIERCARCGKGLDVGYVFMASGGVLCADCAPFAGEREQAALPGPALDAVRYILSAPLKKLFSFDLSETQVPVLARFCEQYLSFKLERGFKTLDFYKNLEA